MFFRHDVYYFYHTNGFELQWEPNPNAPNVTSSDLEGSGSGSINNSIADNDMPILSEDGSQVLVSNKSHVMCVKNVYSYATAFLFIVETDTTVGYGQRAITDECPEAVLLFIIQVCSIIFVFLQTTHLPFRL